MSILINPFPQYNDANGKPLVGGTLSFFESGASTILLPIFKDKARQVAAANPQTIDSNGFLEDKTVFFIGDANVILKDIGGVEQAQTDPVFSFNEPLAQWQEWDDAITYIIGDFVRGSDGLYYRSDVAPNLNNDPVGDPTRWSETQIFTTWNPNVTYSSIDIAIGSDGNIYKSKINSNTGNDPVSSLDEWGPAFDITQTLNIALPRGYKSGFIMSNDAGDLDHDITVTAGAAKDSTNLLDISRTTPITKRIDSDWIEGDDAGGFPSALSLSIDTWYHFFVIVNDLGTVDAGFDSDINATNLLADTTGFTGFRRVGSVLTDSSSNILPFFQRNDWFLWDTPILDIDSVALGTSENLITISTPPDVNTLSQTSLGFSGATGRVIYVRNPDTQDLAPAEPSSSAFIGSFDSDGTASRVAQIETVTDSLSRIAIRAEAATTLFGRTIGWEETF